MTDLRKAAEMALDAMGSVGADLICQTSHHRKKDQHGDEVKCPIEQRWHEAYEALRQALAQPEQDTHCPHCDGIGCVACDARCVPQFVQDHGFDRTASHMTGKYVSTAQLEQEPYCWVQSKLKQGTFYREKPRRIHTIPLYTAPPKQWVGLTDEEIAEGQKQSWVEKQAFESAVWWAEAKLKEKNT